MLLTACSAVVFADQAVLQSFGGNVEIKLSKDKDWTPAKAHARLSEGGGVRTGLGGSAMLEFANSSKLWMKESSYFEIEEHQELSTKIELFMGKLKIRVPHLTHKEIFEVRTSAAICAVKGTELVLDATEDGQLDLAVMYGEVKLQYLLPLKAGTGTQYIAQGLSYNIQDPAKPGTAALLTRERERDLLQDWTPNLSPAQRVAMLDSKMNDRQAIHSYAAQATQTEQFVQSLVAQVREQDYAAGRTLTDVHGNLVRVDQRMYRPDAQSLQVINVVKRPVYDDASGKFAYNGGEVVNRLDSLQLYLTFNQLLPHNLQDWSAFFADNSVHANTAMLVAANQTDTANRFVLAQEKTYDAASGGLKDIGEIYFGTIGAADYNSLAKGNLTSNGDGSTSIGNLVWASKSNTADSLKDQGASALYSYDATQYCIGGNCALAANTIWLGSESYVINNSGAVQDTSSITSSSNISNLFHNLAMETVYYVKQNNASGSGWNAVSSSDVNTWGASTLNNNRNIDLVVLPDIGLAAIQSLLPVINDLK